MKNSKKIFSKALIFASTPILLTAVVPTLSLVGCSSHPDFTIQVVGEPSVTLPAGNITGRFKFKILYDNKDVFHIKKFEKVEIVQNGENEVKISPSESYIPTITDNQFYIDIAFKKNPQKVVSQAFQIKLTYIDTSKAEDEKKECLTPYLSLKYTIPELKSMVLVTNKEQKLAIDETKGNHYLAKYKFELDKDQKIETITAKIVKTGSGAENNVEFYESDSAHGNEINVEWDYDDPVTPTKKYFVLNVGFINIGQTETQNIHSINIDFGNGINVTNTYDLVIKHYSATSL